MLELYDADMKLKHAWNSEDHWGCSVDSTVQEVTLTLPAEPCADCTLRFTRQVCPSASPAQHGMAWAGPPCRGPRWTAPPCGHQVAASWTLVVKDWLALVYVIGLGEDPLDAIAVGIA